MNKENQRTKKEIKIHKQNKWDLPLEAIKQDHSTKLMQIKGKKNENSIKLLKNYKKNASSEIR